MNEKQLRTVVGNLRRVIIPNPATRISDAQLLERFLTVRDELAFEMLVWRHGSMVLNVCRRVLRDGHDAEDAFQATFLIFVRKLRSIGKREAVGSWLYKVAYRVALRARERSAVQRTTPLPDQDQLPCRSVVDDPAQNALWRDLRPLLDEEVNRLPEKYRTPFVLYYLEGMAYPEVAAELGCPKGTVSSRLTTAKGLLRKRLARRGVVLTAALLGAAVAKSARAALTIGLADATLQTMRLIAAGSAAPATAASARAVSLAEGVLKTMMLTKMKLAAVILLAAGVLGFGMSVAIQHAAQAAQPAPTDGSTAKGQAAPDKSFHRPPAIALGQPAPADAKPADPVPEKPMPALNKEALQRYLNLAFPLENVVESPPLAADDGLTDRLAKIEARLAKLEVQMSKVQAKSADLTPLNNNLRTWDLDMGKALDAPLNSLEYNVPFVEKIQTINAKHFKLPVHIDSSKTWTVGAVDLYASANKGKNWGMLTRLDDGKEFFDVIVPCDGLYWFKLRVVPPTGDRAPAFSTETQPDLMLRVVSETNKPSDADALLNDLEAELQAIQKRIAELKAKQGEKPGKKGAVQGH